MDRFINEFQRYFYSFSERSFKIQWKFCRDFGFAHTSFGELFSGIRMISGSRCPRGTDGKRKKCKYVSRDAQLIEDFMKNPQGIGVLMLCSVILFFACVITLKYGGAGYMKMFGGTVIVVFIGLHFITRNPVL